MDHPEALAFEPSRSSTGNLADLPLEACLDHLELGTPDPENLAKFYGDTLDLTVEPLGESWLCQGPARRIVFSQGAAGSLLKAGYRVAHHAMLAGLGNRLRRAGIDQQEINDPLFTGTALSFRDPDGHQMVFGPPRLGAEPVRRGMTARLQHLVVASRDSQKMVDFYTSIIGLQESDRVFDSEGRLRTSFMRSDREHHSFAVFEASETRLDHHCYEAGDWGLIRDWADRFAARRIPLRWGPGRHGAGNNLFIFIHDPDGNWVEISAELDLVAPDRPVGSWPHEEHTLNLWGQAPLRS